MRKSIFIFAVLFFAMVGTIMAMATTTIVEERIEGINTLDPDWCYDTSSGEVIRKWNST